MLGKLIRNEFKNTYKALLTIFGIAVLMTAVCIITCEIIGPMDTGIQILDTIKGIVIFLYILSVIAVVLVSAIYICMRFFRSMYSEQGYLTHTLPASPIATFFVKLGVSTVWVICSVIVMILSLVSIGIWDSGVSVGEFFRTIFEHWSEAVALADKVLLETVGWNLGQFCGIIILFTLVGIISFLTYIFTSMTFGQLSDSHKVGCSIVTAIIIYILRTFVNIFGSVKVFDRVGIHILASSTSIEGTYMNLLHQAVWTLFFIFIGFTVIELVADCFIVKKHINLQ